MRVPDKREVHLSLIWACCFTSQRCWVARCGRTAGGVSCGCMPYLLLALCLVLLLTYMVNQEWARFQAGSIEQQVTSTKPRLAARKPHLV
jgi:hypothetical protein